MSKPYASWAEIRREAERLFSTFVPQASNPDAKQAFDEETIRNSRSFLDYAERYLPLAGDIDHGYWPTLCLYWFGAKPHPVDIEIFGDHFEFWRRIDLIVDVSHFDHEPDAPFPAELAEILLRELR